jgi:hypothetical protein
VETRPPGSAPALQSMSKTPVIYSPCVRMRERSTNRKGRPQGAASPF